MEASGEKAINRKWTIFENQKLGEGAFGVVYKGKVTATGQEVAIKKIRLTGSTIDSVQLMKEIQMMTEASELEHPNIVKTFGQVVSDTEVYIVVELCDATLQKFFASQKPLTEAVVSKIGAQIADGLCALHTELGISHRDLKIDNILLSKGKCKITDFGMSTSKPQHSTKVGAFCIRAPEVLRGEKGGIEVDIWAFGVIMHELMFGSLPFMNRGPKVENFVMAVTLDAYKIPTEPKISAAFADMLSKCFDKDPKKRITAKQLKEHPCFAGKSGN